MEEFKTVTLPAAVAYEKDYMTRHSADYTRIDPAYDLTAALAKLDKNVALCLRVIENRWPVNFATCEDALCALPRGLQRTLMEVMPDAFFCRRCLATLVDRAIVGVPCRPVTYAYFEWWMTYNPARFRSFINDGYLHLDEHMGARWEMAQREVRKPRRRKHKRDWAPRKHIVRCNLCSAICPSIRWPPCVSNPAFKRQKTSTMEQICAIYRAFSHQ